MTPEYSFSNEHFGICSSYDEFKRPKDMLKELIYETNHFINVYMHKKSFQLNDKVTCLGYVGSDCNYSVSFDVNFIPDEDHIFLNFTSVASLLASTPNQMNLYACSIGIVINDAPFYRIDFFIRRKNYTYTKRVSAVL